MADGEDTSLTLLDMKCLQKVVEQVIVLEEKNNSSPWNPIAQAERRTDRDVRALGAALWPHEVMGRALGVSQQTRHVMNNQPNGRNGAQDQNFLGYCVWPMPP